MASFFQIKVIRQFLFFTSALAIFLTSCVNKEIAPVPDPLDPVKSGYIKILLKTPETNIPTNKTYGTRAMSSKAESEIDTEMLNILVFNHNNDDEGNETETFFYMATISGNVVYDENDCSKSAIVVKLMKSISSSDFYRIVVVANHDLSGIEMVRNVTTKQEILEQLTYFVPGKWNIDPPDHSLFPMWGESDPAVVSDDMPSPTINLYRALARIDVGLNFVTDNGKLTEQATGIPGFKLAEVLVFRTFNKGYAAPLNDNLIETPSIPSDALRHSDNSPLVFFIPDAGGADVFAREIYVPEAGLPPTPDNDNIHCIVIGGYYYNSADVSYYRLDFTNEIDPGTRTYLPLLRNHRYVFNITGVKGPGFSSAALALSSVPSTGNIDFDMVVWDATIHEMETQGHYYFGIDNRELLAEAQSTVSDPNNKFTVKYQTNYPLSATNPLRFEWASTINDPQSSPAFDAQWQNDGKIILITVNNDNLTNSILTDTLYVYAGSFVKKIVVRQKFFDIKYTIDCSSIYVKGVYKRGAVLNPSENYITLSIIADNRGMQGRSYVIETTDPENHGISFRAEGIFDFTNIPAESPLRIDTIRMEGSGTLQAPDTGRKFSLPIITNSPSYISCEANIRLVIPHMNIMVLADPDKDFGHSLSDNYSGASKIFNSQNNFGVKENSIVQVEGFSFISSTTDMFTSFSGDLLKWITGNGNGGKIADIVYLANYAEFDNTTTVGLLVDYMNKGGVVVIFNQEPSVKKLVNAVLNVNNITSSALGGGGALFPFPAHSHYHTDANGLQDALNRFEGDPILNGPFGDARDKQWGKDIFKTMTLSNLPLIPNLTIYSYQVDISANKPVANSGNVNGFKYETENRNMVWFGDGGFMTSYQGALSNYNNSCPLSWDPVTFFPEPKYGYGHNIRMPVYNSVVFFNIMAWAIERSESLREIRNNAQ